MTTDTNIGRLLANRYLLTELAGKGAMGQVYKARDKLLGGLTVAVKFLSQTHLNEKMRQSFMREVTISALLGEKSRHIAIIRDYGMDETEVPFYVMEYLQGETLSTIIKSQSLPFPRFLSLSRQICLALQCAHQGIEYEGRISPIIHRDIKPSNILIIPDTTLGELVKIVDFGIAKIQAENTPNHTFMGTLAYSSPEQLEGKELDNRSDIYSLGVMMFEMLTGEIPVMAETRSFSSWYKAHRDQLPKSFESVNTALKLPKAIENLVMMCLAKTPGDRPHTISAVLEALEPLEQRFGQGLQLGQRISSALSKLPIATTPNAKLAPSADEICRLTYWPKDKPVAEIVFPHLLRTSREILPTLWVMLPKQEIQNRHISTRYNQFLFLTSPHPIILWITALYKRQHDPRWLPCYLDLKTRLGQEMTQNLGEAGSYRLLFFALEEPQSCANVMLSTIASGQRQLLKDWVNLSKTLPSTEQPQISKKLLKQEFEKLKPKILMKLEALHLDSNSDYSG